MLGLGDSMIVIHYRDNWSTMIVLCTIVIVLCTIMIVLCTIVIVVDLIFELIFVARKSYLCKHLG